MDLRCGTRSVRSLKRSESLLAVTREVAKYRLGLVGVQEVRWNRVALHRAEHCTVSCGTWNKNYQFGTVT
jgi:hypothetical protein